MSKLSASRRPVNFARNAMKVAQHGAFWFVMVKSHDSAWVPFSAPRVSRREAQQSLAALAA